MTVATEPMVRIVDVKCAIGGDHDEQGDQSEFCINGNPECGGDLMGFASMEFIWKCIPVDVPQSDLRSTYWTCDFCGGQLIFATEPVR